MALIPQIDNQFELKQTEKLIPSKTYKLMQSINTTQKKLKEPVVLEGNELEVNDVGELKGSVSILGNSKQATRSGKNKLDINSADSYNSRVNVEKEGSSLTISRNSTNEGTSLMSIPIKLEANTNYEVTLKAQILKNGFDGGSSVGIRTAKSGGTWIIAQSIDINLTDEQNITLNFNSGENTTAYFWFYLNSQGAADISLERIIKYSEVMVRPASTDNTYEPYGASPSPEFPSEIENVEGKNKFDSEDWYETLNALDSTSMTKEIVNGIEYYKFRPSGIYKYEYMKGKFKENTQYVISCKVRHYDMIDEFCTGFNFYYTDGTNSYEYIKKTLTESDYQLVSEANKTIDYIRLAYAYSRYVLVRNIQIEEGTVATEYAQYNSIGVKVKGKNLCPMNAFDTMNSNGVSNKYDSTNHTITMNTDSVGNSGRYGRPVTNLEIGKKYTISFDIRGTSGKQVLAGWNKQRLTISLTEKYVRYSATYEVTANNEPIVFYSIPADSGGLAIGEYMQFANVQIEEGSIATPYEPYKEHIEYFPLVEGQKLMEGSYLAEDGVHNKRKQIVLDGTEEWYIYDGGDAFEYTYYTNIVGCKIWYNTSICSHFKNVKDTWVNTIGKIGQYTDHPTRPEKYFNTDKPTVAEWKAWLQQNPITVEYELAKEEIVPYTVEQKEVWEKLNNFSLYSPNSFITSSNELAMLKLTYYPVSSIDFETEYIDRIIGYADDLEAIQQAVYHILSIERNAYLIYDENYGVELEQYKGKDLDYIKATIDKVLKDALKHDLRITDVTVSNVEKITNDMVWINFTVNSIYGDLIMEVNVNV